MEHPLVIRRAAARFAAPCALLLASACAATSVQAQEGLIQQLEAMNQRIAALEAQKAQEIQALNQRLDAQAAELASTRAALATTTASLGSVKFTHQTGWLDASRGSGKVHDLGQPVGGGFCFITGVTGRFEGDGEAGLIFAQNGRWHIRIGDQQGGAVRFMVSCVGLPN